MMKATVAAGAVSLCAIGYAASQSETCRRWASLMWFGDTNQAKKRATMEQLQKITLITQKTTKELELVEKSVEILYNKQHAKEEQSSSEKVDEKPGAGNPAEKDSSENGASASGYYHFASNGQKFKSKWDDFDVDAELRRIDEEDERKRVLKQLRTSLLGVESRLEGILAYIDRIRGDAEVQQQRKSAALAISGPERGLFRRVDEVKRKLKACGG